MALVIYGCRDCGSTRDEDQFPKRLIVTDAKRITRVFPRRTKATPTDSMAFVGDPPLLFPPECDEVHISVAFSWDLPEAERLAREWSRVAPVKIGGPATGERGGDFTPGMYLKRGYTITSRGCPNHCWFCSVWKREGDVRELSIADGFNVLDDNLFRCSDKHVLGVFDMLNRQRERPRLTGGIEASALKPWHYERIANAHPDQIFLAYDTPDDYEPLKRAIESLKDAGMKWRGKRIRVYVLIGYPNDKFTDAERRLGQVLALGGYPMAMLYKNNNGKFRTDEDWRKLQRLFARPALMRRAATGETDPAPSTKERA